MCQIFNYGEGKTLQVSVIFLPCLFLKTKENKKTFNFSPIDNNGKISFYSLSLLSLYTALLDARNSNYKLYRTTLALVHHILALLVFAVS